MKTKEKITIGDTNIVSLRFPRIKIKDFRFLGKRFINTLNKATAGKTLTVKQRQQLMTMHLTAPDFPNVPKSSTMQLLATYKEMLAQLVDDECFENASEIRDIIISLEHEIYGK